MQLLAEEEKLQCEREAREESLKHQSEMEADVLATAKAQKQRLVNDFYRDVVAQLNEVLAETLDEILTSLDNHYGQLRGPTSTKLRNFLVRLHSLNFVGDQSIEDQIARVQATLPTTVESEQASKGLARIDTRRLQQVTRAVRDEANETLMELETMGLVRSPRRRSAIIHEDALVDLGGRKPRAGELGFKKPRLSRSARRRALSEE